MNFNWIKNNKTWKISNNDINLSDIKEIAKPYENLNIIKSDKNKPVIYVPVHNIHDIYEWYRLFFDRHITQDPNFITGADKFGFWIHGFFDKESSQSIDTYFPNLKLVKAASSDSVIIYDNDYKYYDGFVDINATYPTFELDGVNILDGEYVLLKNQIKYIGNKVTVLNYTDFTVEIPYFSGVEKEFKIGSLLRWSDGTSLFSDTKILNFSSDGITVIITVESKMNAPLYVYDKFNNSYNIDNLNNGIFNGVYQYKDKQLTMIPDMTDEFKVFNQIVYCYQGKTNQNKEFYLRRIEIPYSPHYGKFSSGQEPYIYSEGSAHLIKFEFDYDLDINNPEHPTGYGHFIDNSANNTAALYRLLFLDQDIASKIMIKDQHGLGEYVKTEINLSSGLYRRFDMPGLYGTAFFNILFSTTTPDYYGKQNVIGEKIEKGIWENYPLEGSGINNGTHYIAPNETQIIEPISNYTIFDYTGFATTTIPCEASFIHVAGSFNPRDVIFDNNAIVGQQYTTNITVNDLSQSWSYFNQLYTHALYRYLVTAGVENPLTTMINGSYLKLGVFVKIKVEYNINNAGYYTALDETFLITKNNFVNDFVPLVDDPYVMSANATNYNFNIYPKLSDNFINEYNNYTDSSRTDVTYKITFDLIQSFDVYNINLPDIDNSTHAKLVESAISKFELDKIYEVEVNPSINYLGNDAITINIPNLILTDTILAATPTGMNTILPVTFNIGDLLIIHAQDDHTENGIYIFQGPNKKLLRSNILFDSTTVFESNCSISLITSSPILYTATLLPSPIDGFPIYGETNIDFIELTSGLSTDIIIHKPRQEYNKKYKLYSTTLSDYIGNTADFISKWEIQNNSNLFPVNLHGIYTDNYSVTNYLTEYLGIHNYPTTSQALEVIGFSIPPINYYNIEDNINRLGFEQNKIIFGSTFKNDILRIKEQILITISYNAEILSDIFIYKIVWDETKQIVEVYTDFNFDTYAIPPSTMDSISFTFETDLDIIQTKIFDRTQIIDGYRPDTASYAYYLMNYLYIKGTTEPSSIINETITAIWYKENSEPKVSFSKRDKFFNTTNNIKEVNPFPYTYYTVDVATISAINILVAPASVDGYFLTIGETILVKNNIPDTQNGIYTFNGVGVPLLGSLSTSLYYYSINGNNNANKYFQKFGRKYVIIPDKKLVTKSDPRLYLRPIEIAKLGVNHETQPWYKISYKYDISETTENLVNIQIGINNRKRIRFIDGLTEYNILHNINGQGQYDWILADNVELEDAVVGCTQEFGPGTGTLIWYTGTWFDGTFVDGIWISGTFVSGTWLNGVWHSYSIQDYWTYVQYTEIEIFGPSIWQNGVWHQGIWNGGTWKNGTWLDGTWNNGLWENGTWSIGTWNNGTWKKGTWNNGTWNNGIFEAGTWNNGTFDKIDGSFPSIFGYNSTNSNKAIWYKGTFMDGEVWSGFTNTAGIITPSIDNHRNTIIFSARVQYVLFRSGTIVSCFWDDGIFENGVWLGGYYATFSIDNNVNSKKLDIDPNQYYNALGVTNLAHNLHNYSQTQFFVFGHLTAGNEITQAGNLTFWQKALLPMFETSNPSGNPYTLASLDTAYVNDNTHINLFFATPGSATTPIPLFISENISTGELNENPFIPSIWVNGTWKNGTWVNGYAYNGIFEQGQFLRGYIRQASKFGVDFE